MIEPAGAAVVAQHLVQLVAAHVAEGGVPQVVCQGDGLGQILVEAQGAGDGAADLGDLDGMREPGERVDASIAATQSGALGTPESWST